MSWLKGRATGGNHASIRTRKPVARSEHLVIEEMGDELLVYDETEKRAHSLSATAARVWRACDGNTGIDGLTTALELPRDTVVKALEELEGAELLESDGLQIVNGANGNGNGLTRREMTIRTAKIGGAVAAAPMLYSIAVPSSAAAATPTNRQCALFSTDACGVTKGGGAVAGCCCCCEASNCKVAGSINGCKLETCPNGVLGHCSSSCSGNQCGTAVAGGSCCQVSGSTGCGCAWSNSSAGNICGQSGAPPGCAAGCSPGAKNCGAGCCNPTSAGCGTAAGCAGCTPGDANCVPCCNGVVLSQTATFGCCTPGPTTTCV